MVEINNGRLAMIGIMGFLAEEKVPGAVPALAGLIKPYAGQVMDPFTQLCALRRGGGLCVFRCGRGTLAHDHGDPATGGGAVP